MKASRFNHKLRSLASLVLVGFCLFALQAKAMPVHTLYQANLIVSSQTKSERERSLPRGLLQVLVRVSGNKRVGSLPEVASRMLEAYKFVECYSYQELKQADRTVWQLTVSYDPKAVNSLLQGAGQAIWGEDRPALLVWFVEGDANKPHLLAADTDPYEKLTSLMHYAELRGIPLLFPILDLYDLSRVDPHDVWQGKLTAVKKASRRYGDQPLLIVRVSKEEQLIKGRWLLVIENDPVIWDTESTEMQTVLSEGVDYIANALAARYAVLSTQSAPENIRLVVDGVSNVKDYIAVMGRLRDLPAVTRVDVEEINPQEAHFILSFKGSITTLRDLLSQQNLLIPSNGAAKGDAETSEAVLRYHLATQS